ncbi:MAG: glycosyl transferase family 1 [Geobacter sp.]|nr:MAG: glycosyl transferase family 1 [Geobacter sp.]
MQKLKIALIGTRGVPANYGGFETFYEELGKRLVARGHDVTVYCRDSYYPDKLDSYLGMRLVYQPNIKKKSLDTLSHTLFSILHAIRQPYDIFMICNAANSPVLLIPRLLGKRIAINTDGLEWKRGKWGKLARTYYKLCERISTVLAHRVVADSLGIQDYYASEYNASTTYIPYGAYQAESKKPELLDKFSLKQGEYFLQITRFEPDNNPLLTIQAFKQLTTDKKLVIVGGVPYESSYSRKIASEAAGHPNIVLPGPIYHKELLNEIWYNCFAYIHGNEVGGTNPALLQTMATGCFTIAIDVCFSREVLNVGGIYFSKNSYDLADKMQWALTNQNGLDSFKIAAQNRIRERYSWDSVADDYERMFCEMLR